MTTLTSPTQTRNVVSRDQWTAARKELLRREKEHTRQRDALARLRRELPWVKVDKAYSFDGPNGQESLADLFAGRSQLIVYHFMLGPGWAEGCPGCSFVSDHIDGALPHIAARDATLLAVSRAPFPEIEAFKRRMGWGFKWVSSFGSDFNHDFRVSFTKEELAWGEVEYNYEGKKQNHEELPGASVFVRGEDGEAYHTYSTYARGLEDLVTAYGYIDLLPKGRAEEGLEFPMAWVRHHDKYENAPARSCCSGSHK
jgi:predicted dithiol-disulfide oxidoreductase (DUF899 family)